MDAIIRPHSKRQGAFTLVEVMIVLIILGILAAIIIPTFSNAADEARQNSIKMNLQRIRTQIEVYKDQHNGEYPTLADFEDQMTLASNSAGTTAAVGTLGFPHGPYIREVPDNPNTKTSDIGTGAAGTSAWYYDQTTGEFRANDSAETRAF